MCSPKITKISSHPIVWNTKQLWFIGAIGCFEGLKLLNFHKQTMIIDFHNNSNHWVEMFLFLNPSDTTIWENNHRLYFIIFPLWHLLNTHFYHSLISTWFSTVILHWSSDFLHGLIFIRKCLRIIQLDKMALIFFFGGDGFGTLNLQIDIVASIKSTG